MAKWLQSAKCWLDVGLAFIYPEVCQMCDSQRATADEGFICMDCRKDVKFISEPFCGRCGLPFEGELTMPFECGNCRGMELHFTHARSAVAAKGLLLEVIHKYKYHRCLWIEPFLAHLLISCAVPALTAAEWDLLVPVPLHKKKQQEREFNQAERLAVRLSKASKIPVARKALVRTKLTQTQTHLSRRDRSANVRRAFALGPKADVRGKRIVLIDDVLTTGATVDACARVLLEGGAQEVCVWTVARGLLH